MLIPPDTWLPEPLILRCHLARAMRDSWLVGLVGHIVGPEGHVRNVGHAFFLKLVTFLMVSDVLIHIRFFFQNYLVLV